MRGPDPKDTISAKTVRDGLVILLHVRYNVLAIIVFVNRKSGIKITIKLVIGMRLAVVDECPAVSELLCLNTVHEITCL